MPHGVMRADVAGRDVTRHLQLLLRKEGHHFHTSAEFEVVRTIKEVGTNLYTASVVWYHYLAPRKIAYFAFRKLVPVDDKKNEAVDFDVILPRRETVTTCTKVSRQKLIHTSCFFSLCERSGDGSARTRCRTHRRRLAFKCAGLNVPTSPTQPTPPIPCREATSFNTSRGSGGAL
jgi:hypothetical protein